MATADISKEAVFDQRIVQSPARYAVEKGGLSLTNAPFNAISASASQMSFNINVPSQNVFVDRAIEMAASVGLAFNVAVNAAVAPYVAGQPVIAFGRDIALAAFPLQQLIATATATINDTSATINLDTVMKEVLRLTDYRKNRLSRTCPTMLDKYAHYDDSYLAVNSPLASYLDATDPGLVPNGAWWNIQYTDATGAALVGAGSYVSGGVTVSYVAGVPVRANPDPAQYPLFIKFFSTEKLLLSPFVFADACEYETGLFSINNIQLVLNMKSAQGISRVLRATTGGGRTVSAVQFNNFSATGSPFQSARVNVQFVTPSLALPLPAKSIVQYLEFPRYISNNYQQIAAGQSSVLNSQTIVLPQIPDMLIIYCKPVTEGDNHTADFYLPITAINVNFDNFAGLLSSHTTEQLYAMAVHNGLEMDFDAWRGYAYSGRTGALIQTVGGFLVLKPGIDLALQEGQAPGLLGRGSVFTPIAAVVA